MELTIEGKDPKSGLIIDKNIYNRFKRSQMTPEQLEDDKRKKREYYHRNKEKMRAAMEEWRFKNRAKVRKKQKQYARERTEIDPQFKARTYYQIKLAQGMGYIRRGYFPEHRKPFLGCTWKELKGHIERQFEPGMLWANYGVKWSIDHIVPRTEFDLLDEAEVVKCFYYKNLRPRWDDENCGKVGSVKRSEVPEIDPVPTDAVLAEMACGSNRRGKRKLKFFADLVPKAA
jgi:hypothetical protein